MEWFPRMRAMSLAAEDSEGEQNEMRVLQSQLEATTSLVLRLSAQLADLKEQVSSLSHSQSHSLSFSHSLSLILSLFLSLSLSFFFSLLWNSHSSSPYSLLPFDTLTL